MKGVMMKIGQMASYVDDGLSPAVRHTLSRLQDSVPPMSPELATGRRPGRTRRTAGTGVRRLRDQRPSPPTSIGRVHRTVRLDGHAVTMKVQYPGIAATIAADLHNVALLHRMLRITARAQDVNALVAELRDRVLEELDYHHEASNQQLMADYFDGHPTIHRPRIIGPLSTRRVIARELSSRGPLRPTHRLASGRTRPGHRDDLPLRLPPPLRSPRIRWRPTRRATTCSTAGAGVTFLDFGLVKHFTPAKLRPLMQIDPPAVRRTRYRGVSPQPGKRRLPAPARTTLSTNAIIEHLAVFYDTIREPSPADHHQQLRLLGGSAASLTCAPR